MLPSRAPNALKRAAPAAAAKIPWLLFLTVVASTFIGTDAIIANVIGGPAMLTHSEDLVKGPRTLLWTGLYAIYLFLLVREWRVAIAAIASQPMLLVVLSYFILSMLWSHDPPTAASSALQLTFSSFFGVFAGYRLGILNSARAVGIGFSLVGILSLIFVVALPRYGIMDFNYVGAWQGVYFLKNNLATNIEMGFASFLLLAFSPMKTEAWFYRLMAVLGVVLIVGSQSKGALVFVVATPIIMYFLHSVRTKSFTGLTHAYVIGTISLVVVTIGLFSFETVLELLGKDPTLTGRVALWDYAAGSFGHRPLLGFGYYSYWSDPAPFAGKNLNSAETWDPHSLHNSWLELLMQGGVAGIAICIVYIWTITKQAFGALKFGNQTIYFWPALVMIYILGWSFFKADLLRHQDFFTLLPLLVAGAVCSEQKARGWRAASQKPAHVGAGLAMAQSELR